MPASIERFFEELVDDVKVVLQRRRSDFSKVFDEDVQERANERKRIQRIDCSIYIYIYLVVSFVKTVDNVVNDSTISRDGT